jgi:hypothetical protein
MLLFLAALAPLACSRRSERNERNEQKACTGHLERVSDPRSPIELAKLPEIVPHTTLHHGFREPRMLALSGVEEGVEQIGDYRVTWWVDSDRGRPGPAQVTLSLPNVCEGGEIVYEFTGTGGWPGRLLRDAANHVDVLVLLAWRDTEAIAFRLVPGPPPAGSKPQGRP